MHRKLGCSHKSWLVAGHDPRGGLNTLVHDRLRSLHALTRGRDPEGGTPDIHACCLLYVNDVLYKGPMPFQGLDGLIQGSHQLFLCQYLVKQTFDVKDQLVIRLIDKIRCFDG